MAWTIEYTATALKQIRKFDRQDARRILDFMDNRIAKMDNPRDAGKALKDSALGTLWRFRVGDYRIVCDIQDERLCVLVVGAGHRREIYR